MNENRKKRKIKYRKNIFKLRVNYELIDKIEPIISFKKEKNDNVIFFMILSIIISVCLLLNINLYGRNIVYKYKNYNIGSTITLFNDSNWIVLSEYSNVITLLDDNLYDINSDGIIDDNDKIKYDEIDSFLKNESETNFAYANTVRLMNSSEYVFVREYMKFGYDWYGDNFLASSNVNSYWLSTKKFDKIISVNNHGSYTLCDFNDYNYLRFIIQVDKKYIKN